MHAVTLNLIPADLLMAQRRRIHFRGWLLALAPCLAFLVMALWLHGARRQQVEALKLSRHQMALRLSELRKDVNEATAAARHAQLQLQRFAALRDKRNWSAVFALLDQSMPEGTWLSSIATDPAVPPPVTARPHLPAATATVEGTSKSSAAPPSVEILAPRKLRLIGLATDVTLPLKLVTRLRTAEAFSNVVLERSQREPPGSLFRFELVCEW